MAHPPITPLVPFDQANAETRAAFLEGLKVLRGLDGNPEAWKCTRCDQTTSGGDVLISYGVGDTPIPYCPAEGCSAYGPELKPVPA